MVLLVAAGGTTYYFMVVRPNTEQTSVEEKPNNTVDYDSATDEQKRSGEQAKSDFLERQEEKEVVEQTPSGTSSISISNVTVNGALLQVRTTITNATGGQCKLTLEKQGEPSITREANTQNLGSYDTCMGFDVDTSGLKKGAWNLSLYYTGDPAGTQATKTVEIQ